MRLIAAILRASWRCAFTAAGVALPRRARTTIVRSPVEEQSTNGGTYRLNGASPIAWTAFVLGPAAIVMALLWLLCNTALWKCVPIWHDEVWYYNEIAVFHAAGWEGGYTVSHEWPAKAEAIRFGPHGPWFPAFYGMLARVTGMHIALIPMLNTVLLVLASLLWVITCRPQGRQAWLAAFVMMTFWPLVLYLPSSMQEGLHMSIALVLAALGVGLIRNPASHARLAFALVVVALAAQLRVTWAWMVVPMLWVSMRPKSTRAWVVLSFAAAAFVGVLHVEGILLTSPYPNFIGKLTGRLGDAPLTAIGMVIAHTFKNVVRYVSPLKDTFLQIGMRYQTLLVLGVAIYFLRRSRKSRTSASSGGDIPRQQSAEATSLAFSGYGFALFSLVCVWAFVIVFYDVFDWRDYRVVAPHLLVAVLVLAACGTREWIRGYAIIALCLGVLAVPQFVQFNRARGDFDTARIAAFADQVEAAIPFRRDLPGWDNTLLIDIDPLTCPTLAGLPGGIGVSVVNYWDQQAWPPRSKYVLLNGDLAKRLGVPETYRKVATTELGDIYITR